MQSSLGDNQKSEDCLTLNIFIPHTQTQPKAVMLWIHGGGYVVSQGNISGATLALTGDVIAVTINYRLDIFGFLYTGDKSSRGNYGLWDQLMALKYIKDNIASFGGDPQRITIFGVSAGGYSVGLLMTIPQSKGLFQRAICESGVGTSPRALAFNALKFTRNLSDRLNCTVLDSKQLNTVAFMACLRTHSARTILSASSYVREAKTLAWRLEVAPVIDGELIPSNPRMLISQANQLYNPMVDIDLMAGTQNGDGILILGPLKKFQKQLHFNVKDGIPTKVFCKNISTSIAQDYFPSDHESVAEKICEQYSSKDQSDSDQARKVVDMFGDMMFAAPTVATLLAHSRNSNNKETYHYVFSHQRANSKPLWFRGTKHGQEVAFVFGFKSVRNTSLSKHMMKYWTNFAKFGNPNSESGLAEDSWPRFDEKQQSYLKLDNTIAVGTNLWSQRMKFWMTDIMYTHNDLSSTIPSPGASSNYNALLTLTGFFLVKLASIGMFT